ncbi:hypothetical protein DVK85_09275 [Flavobacterium arcticum]|uniref:Uncharacterized protein n=1 Tax=Flavobacterium arcticum TaxID=1784713 RepID=A0A345HCV2_9FLAO|nr:hypothetical protein [Flavobacterium arcticum]AXG74412.1 hypothetical protein DVK85_09275 [Flavobacterium arcticum]KAF2512468.1 hypothetical protein E0W72_04390 [Flavobacterium arcticum]
MDKIKSIIANSSALLCLLVFMYQAWFVDTHKFTLWQWVFISLSALLLIILILCEIFYSDSKKYKIDDDIKDYMRNWINNGGRTVIFTRDMTWVSDVDIKNILKTKAKNNELIICQPKLTNFTIELQKLGAEIYTYDKLNFEPKSRFTFINYNTNSSKVAIGKKGKNNIHYINEFSMDDAYEYHLAEDLVNLIKAINHGYK